MKNRALVLLLASFLLVSCNQGTISKDEEKDVYTASFLLNFKAEVELPSGNIGQGENLVYDTLNITLGEKISKPTNDPVRPDYDFMGWCKEEECITPWNFDTDIAEGNLFLYAKWGTGSTSEYVEPDYTYPETIITNEAFRLTGILNIPVENSTVKLSTGAINRLRNSPEDVKFAVNYERRQDVTITSATYDASLNKITIKTSDNQTFQVNVVDNSPSLSMASVSSSYETKASNYETKDTDAENYHVMLAGSSSMEFWETSKEDLNPIVSYNHGIGGTTVEQWTTKLFERLVTPYSPKAIVYYVGVNNIINGGDSGEICGNKLVDLFNKTHQNLPNTRVFYVLINKLPGYLKHQSSFDVANNMAIEYAKDREWISCVDAGACLIKESGLPNSAFFRTDGLHMSKYGYVLWGGQIKKTLIDWLG